MTDLEFNEWLRDALEQAALEETAPLLAAGEDAAPAWSRRYLKRRTKLLADPFAYAKRASRPAWKQALVIAGKAAACLVLAASLTLAVSPAARAWGVKLIRTWFSDNVEYRFAGTGQSEPAAWRPTYLPEGYSLVDTFAPTPVHITLTYENADGIYISITCDFVTEGSGGFAFDNEHSDVTTAEVNGIRADLYVTNTPGKPSYLIWMDEAANTAFLVYGEVDTAELIRIGESLEKAP